MWFTFGEAITAGWTFDGGTGTWSQVAQGPAVDGMGTGRTLMASTSSSSSSWADPGWGGTPGWRISLIFTLFVVLSFGIEKGLHVAERNIRAVGYKGLLHTMRKVEEELLILGFLSLLLTAFSSLLVRICVDCPSEGCAAEYESAGNAGAALLRRALLSATDACSNPCPAGKEPFWTAEALHQTHLFVFTLAIIFILYSATSMVLGWLRVMTWRGWEIEAVEKCTASESLIPPKSLVIPEGCREDNYLEICHANEDRSWIALLVTDFANQFYRSVSTARYINLRRAFVERSRLDANFDFVTYVNTSIQEDFALIVGLDWLLWLIAAVWIALDSPDGTLNIYIYFWMPALAMVAQLAVGTKIMSMARTLEENGFLYFTARKEHGATRWQAAKGLSRSASINKPLADLDEKIHSQRDLEQRSALARQNTMNIRDLEVTTRLGLDASEVLYVQFWFDRNILFIYLFQFIMFVNVFIISMLIFSTWQGLTDTLVFNGMPWWSVVIVVVVQLLLVFHAAWFILPVYILVTCAGSKYNARFLGQTIRHAGGGGLLGFLGFRKDAHKKSLEREKQAIMIRDINKRKEAEVAAAKDMQPADRGSFDRSASVGVAGPSSPVAGPSMHAEPSPAPVPNEDAEGLSLEEQEAPLANRASVSTWHAHSRAGSGIGLTSFAEIRAQALAASRGQGPDYLDGGGHGEDHLVLDVGDGVDAGTAPRFDGQRTSEATALDEFRASGEQVTIGRTSEARRLLSAIREGRPPHGAPIPEDEGESEATPASRTPSSATRSRQSVRDIFGSP